MPVNIAIIENNIIATNTIREKLTRSLIEHGYQVTILTTGKDADIVIHSHSPFEYRDKVVEVYEKGVRITWPDIF